MERKIVVVIPARYGSSRFPGKPLAIISGKTMIRRVYENVAGSGLACATVVATDDERIQHEVQSFGGKTVMTGEYSCGTERVWAAVQELDADIVVNVQGDEPLVGGGMLRNLLSAFDDPDVQMSTLKVRIVREEEASSPDVVKVVTGLNGDALYFSRHAIPYDRDGAGTSCWRHIGIYAYTKEFLGRFVAMSRTPLEIAESLEQLRALENGYKIRVVETRHASIGVDTPADIATVERYIAGEKRHG